MMEIGNGMAMRNIRGHRGISPCRPGIFNV
jgi:hypothetical protein